MITGLVAVGHLLSLKVDKKTTFREFNHILSACLTEKLIHKSEADDLFEEYFKTLVKKILMQINKILSHLT